MAEHGGIIPQPRLTKVPGELPKLKAESHVEDLSKLTKPQLLELRDRQLKLLANKARLSKLPDKGKRINDLYDKIEKELALKNEIESAANMFSDLNIASTGRRKLDNLEWTGKASQKLEIVVDSDDEEDTDPLKIIARADTSKVHVKYVKPEEPLITQKDLEEIESFKNEKMNEETAVPAEIVEIDLKEKVKVLTPLLEQKLNGNSSRDTSNSSLNLEPQFLYICEKEENLPPLKEKFRPYKTTKSNVHDPEKEIQRKKGKHWEITAATPPPIQHPGAKALSLRDVVEVHADYMQRMKEQQEKHAQERLAAKLPRGEKAKIALPDESIRKLNAFFGGYRESGYADSGSDSEEEAEYKFDSDDGVHDDEDEKGGVTFVVYK